MDSFAVAVLDAKVARQVIVKYHYSHAWPVSNFANFGAFVGKRLVGVVTYGYGANPNTWKSVPGCEKSRHLVELTRLWIADSAPPFVESRTIAASIRQLRKSSTDCRVLVSYADPAAGHVGVVYQAMNWVYVGQMAESEKLLMADGTMLHKRGAFDRFGTDDAKRLQSVSPGIQPVVVPGKHKYLYALDRSLSGKIKMLAKPYPRAVPERGAADQAATGGADPTTALHNGIG